MQQETSLEPPHPPRAPVWLAVLALVVGLLLTTLAVYVSKNRIQDESWYRFSLQFDRLDRSVRDQIMRPLAALQGLAGMHAAHGHFDEHGIRDWVGAQDLSQQYQGVIGFGYMEWVRRAGTPDRLIVRYLEPAASNRQLIGQDALQDPAIRAALQFVETSGEPSLAPMLKDASGQRKASEYLLVLPFYQSAKRDTTGAQSGARQGDAAIQGLVFARMDLNTLLLPSISIAEGLLDFEVTDAAQERGDVLVFRSANVVDTDAASAPGFADRQAQNRRGVVVGARLLNLEAGSSARFEMQIDRTTPRLVGAAGVLLSVLLALIFWLLISGRIRAQRLAQRMTRDLDRMARVVRSTSHLVYVSDSEEKIIWANEAFCRFAQSDLQACIGTTIFDLLQFDDQSKAAFGVLREAVDRRESTRHTLPLQTAHQGTQWFDIDLQIERDEEGRYLGYLVIAADITQQQLATQRLQRALRENQALLDAIDEHSIVSITDAAGKILYANEMFSKVSGYSREELLGNNHRLVKSKHQTDAYWESMWKTISSGYHWRDTVCNRAKDGSLYWVDTVITPFFDENGQIERYISIRSDVTQVLKFQAELQDERRHLQAILEGTNAGTWELEISTGQNFINDRWAEMLGYQREELGDLSLQRWTALCHPDDVAAVNTAMRRHFARETPFFEREFRMLHREGHWVWIQSRGKVTSWTDDGKPHWVSGIHLDVSAQKKLQSDLHQSNLVMQTILENIPVALSVFDKDLNLIARNERFRELLEFPASLFEVPVVTFESLIRHNALRGDYGPGDPEAIVAQTVERARHTVAHQFERERSNGVALEVRGAPMPGGGFITTYADITERRRAAAELARSTRMLQSVLDSASEVAVITVSEDGVITLFNKGAERMLGYQAEEMIGKRNVQMLLDSSEVQARASAMSASLGRTVQGLEALVDESVLGKRNEWTYIHQSGRRFTVALVVTALTDADGKRIGYLGVSHDITLEKEREARLQVAMEEAEQAATAKGQFLANMSHEIRTPMNAILGMLKLLQNTALDTRQQDYTNKTESAARSLLGLLNDILDFSKAEAGKMVLDPQPFALDQVMRDLSVILSANIGAKQIEVLFDLDPQLPAGLVGDSLRLQQVLINLGGNAVKFTEQGEVVVSVQVLGWNLEAATSQAKPQDSEPQETVPPAGVAPSPPQSVRLRFAVRDSGIGIDAKHQQHIFSGFSQAEASTTRRFGGTGLGLSICRRLVALMGGELQVDSEVGRGSTFHFTVTLPIAPELNAVAISAPPEPLTLLIVDDNAIARQVHQALAQALGWQTQSVSSGAAALQEIALRKQRGDTPFDVVLVDWHMPELDGWDCAQAIRAQQDARHRSLLLMVTANGRELLAQRAEQSPDLLDGFLVKPITGSMLLEAVHEARERRRHPGRRPLLARVQAKRLAGLRLLVVEDNAINQQVARELLSAEGAHIDLAGNGQLGVEAVAHAKTPYDAVLMDLQMPVMDGYTAAVAIRNELGLRDLPIIAMTANAMASDREACLAAGMNDHIGKPFDVPQLVAMLCQHTGHQPQTALEPSALEPSPDAHPPAMNPLSTDAAAAARASLLPSTLLDVAAAMAMLGDNADLYQSIAQSYLDEIKKFGQQLPLLLQGEDLTEATRQLHTIKGLSLTVGAPHLAGVCRIGESQLKAASGAQALSAEALEALRADLLAAIDQTHSALSEAIAKMATATTNPTEPAGSADHSTSAHAPASLDRHRLVQDLQRLRDRLHQSDMQALDLHQELRQTHTAVQAELMPLKAALDAFDFAQAVVQCGDLINKYGSDN